MTSILLRCKQGDFVISQHCVYIVAEDEDPTSEYLDVMDFVTGEKTKIRNYTVINKQSMMYILKMTVAGHEINKLQDRKQKRSETLQRIKKDSIVLGRQRTPKYPMIEDAYEEISSIGDATNLMASIVKAALQQEPDDTIN